MDDYRFKMVTPENLMEPDTVVGYMGTIENGEVRPMSPQDFIRPILAVGLDEPVPLIVRQAFYFARNAMCYGYWYWPALRRLSTDLRPSSSEN